MILAAESVRQKSIIRSKSQSGARHRRKALAAAVQAAMEPLEPRTLFSTVTGVYAVGNPVPNNALIDATPAVLDVQFDSQVLGADVASNWELLKNGMDITSQITHFGYDSATYGASLTLATALSAGGYQLTAR